MRAALIFIRGYGLWTGGLQKPRQLNPLPAEKLLLISPVPSSVAYLRGQTRYPTPHPHPFSITFYFHDDDSWVVDPSQWHHWSFLLWRSRLRFIKRVDTEPLGHKRCTDGWMDEGLMDGWNFRCFLLLPVRLLLNFLRRFLKFSGKPFPLILTVSRNSVTVSLLNSDSSSPVWILASYPPRGR